MKSKVIRGRGFRGLLNYLLAICKLARILGGNMTGRNTAELSREFAFVRQLRPDCTRPVLHIPLRMPDGEDVTDAIWREIAVRMMEEMGLSPDRPWLLVKHPDQHVHLVTSRIDYHGQIWYGKWEAFTAIRATAKLEEEFHLTITPTLMNCDPTNVRLTSGQLKKLSKEADSGNIEVPAKMCLAEHIPAAIEESDGTVESFIEKLKNKHVGVRLNKSKTGHVAGISFEYDGFVMKGSKVARQFSWLGILELLKQQKGTGSYESQRSKSSLEIENPGGDPTKIATNPADKRPDQSIDPSRSGDRAMGGQNSQGHDNRVLVDNRADCRVGGDGDHHCGPAPHVEPQTRTSRRAKADDPDQQRDSDEAGRVPDSQQPSPDPAIDQDDEGIEHSKNDHGPSDRRPESDDSLDTPTEQIEPRPPRVRCR